MEDRVDGAKGEEGWCLVVVEDGLAGRDDKCGGADRGDGDGERGETDDGGGPASGGVAEDRGCGYSRPGGERGIGRRECGHTQR